MIKIKEQNLIFSLASYPQVDLSNVKNRTTIKIDLVAFLY